MSNRKLTLTQPVSSVFVSSDIHFGHRFMAGLRGFGSDTEAHDWALVRNWNQTVPKDATVILLGDISFANVETTARLVDALNGEKFVVPGNHDDSKRLDRWFGSDHVLPQLLTIKVINPKDATDSLTFEASHYPLASWNNSDHGRLHLHGHLHSQNNKVSHHFCSDYEGAGVRFDVGIDNAAWFGVPLSPLPLALVRNRYNKALQAKGSIQTARERAEKEWDRYVIPT